MKNKIIRHNIFILVVSIFTLFLISSIIVQQNSQKIIERHLINYSQIVKKLYVGNNEQEVINEMYKIEPNVRITFIDQVGTVLYDTLADTNENHLNRPELKQLGTIQVRYSGTLKTHMMYYAIEAHGNYLRVAIPTSDNSRILIEFFVIMALITLGIAVVTSYIVKKVTDMSMVPLNNAVKALAKLSNDDFPISETYDTETITKEISRIKFIIETNLKEIKNQKDKIEYIVDNMHQGIIVIDSSRNIVIINQYACSVFNYNQESIIYKDLLYLTRNNTIINAIEKTLVYDSNQLFDVEIDSSIYSFVISSIRSDWIGGRNRGVGVLVIISDVTQIRNLDHSKKEFFANASHELKSPLTSVIGFLEMITEGVIVDKDEILTIINKALNESKRASTLINEMLMLSRLEVLDDVKENITEVVNLKEVVLQTIESLTPQLLSMNLTLTHSLVDAEINASKDHMYALVRNLLDNAIKYNNINGKIDISLTKNDIIELSIKDTGIGILKKDQKRIFERFYRVDKARSKKMGGTGLGLAIVKHICVLYNAKIEVISEINKGSTFKIIL